jgi:hypothetical protein
MRRVAILFVSMLSVTLLGSLPARAQLSSTPSPSASPGQGGGSTGGPDVALTLLGESVWNGPNRPLTLTVRATNEGVTTVADLSVFLTIGSPTRSRSLFEESLSADPTLPVFTFPYPQGGSLAPGASHTFHLEQSMDIPTIGGESALYPLRIDLRSGDETLATIRTPMIFLAEAPRVPLSVAWTLVLADPMQFGPDGVLGPGPVEADIAPGGRLDREVAAIDGRHPVGAELALSPVLLSELERMAGGYQRRDASGAVEAVDPGTGGAQDASRLLAALSRAASRPSVEVVALPLGDALIPATIHARFRNLTTLLTGGRDVIQSVLGVTASRLTFRPPGSELDAQSLAQLAGRGVTTLLVDGGFIPAPQTLTFSPTTVARVTGSGRAATAVLPDEGAEALAIAYPDDPVLAAHAVLGELAARYFELPNAPGRGAAMLFPERPFGPTGLFGPLAGLLDGSPWLSTVTVTGLLARVSLGTTANVPVPARTYPSFDAGYLASLAGARSALADFRATVVGADRVEAAMDGDLLAAQAGSFVTDPQAGLAYIDVVRSTIDRTYRAVAAPPTGYTITLPSQHGVVPLTIRNDSPYEIHAQVELTAVPQLTIDGGGIESVTLPAKASVPLQFSVSAKTTGRFPMGVRILTPTGVSIVPAPGDDLPQIVVRSTAYNRVALVITIGAALFLALWWGRRFLPRRTS